MKRTTIADFFRPKNSSEGNRNGNIKNKQTTKSCNDTSCGVSKSFSDATKTLDTVQQRQPVTETNIPSTISSTVTRRIRFRNSSDLHVDSAEEKSLPIPFHEFLEYTNVLDIVDAQIQTVRPQSYEKLVNNLVYVKKIARFIYLDFYMKPKYRKRFPLKNITVSDDCPDSVRLHIMEIPKKYHRKHSEENRKMEDQASKTEDVVTTIESDKTGVEIRSSANSNLPNVSVDISDLLDLTSSSSYNPPSFKVFKKFVNFDEELKERLGSFAEKNLLDNETALRAKLEMEFYKNFYAAPTTRNKLKWILRPCPRTIREQILTHLPLKEDTRPDDKTQTAAENSELTQRLLNNLSNETQPNGDFPYPVSFEMFKMFTLQNEIVDEILQSMMTSKDMTVEDFEKIRSDENMRQQIFKNYYDAFYRIPHIRDKYSIKLKPCPPIVRDCLLKVPTTFNDSYMPRNDLILAHKRSPSPKQIQQSPPAKKRKTLMETEDLSTDNLSPNGESSREDQAKTTFLTDSKGLTTEKLLCSLSRNETFKENQVDVNIEIEIESQPTEQCTASLSPHDGTLKEDQIETIVREVEGPPAEPPTVSLSANAVISKEIQMESIEQSTIHLTPNIETLKEVEVKTISVLNTRIVKDYFERKIRDYDEQKRCLLRESLVKEVARNLTCNFNSNMSGMMKSTIHENSTSKLKRKRKKNIPKKNLRRIDLSSSSSDSSSPDKCSSYIPSNVNSDETDKTDSETDSDSELNRRITRSLLKSKIKIYDNEESGNKTPFQSLRHLSDLTTTNTKDAKYCLRKRKNIDTNMISSSRESNIAAHVSTCTHDSDEAASNSELDEISERNFSNPTKPTKQLSQCFSTLNSQLRPSSEIDVNENDLENTEKVHNDAMQKVSNDLAASEQMSIVDTEKRSDIIVDEQCIPEYILNDTFFRQVNKDYSLAYAVRRSRGLKRRILIAILKMSFDEFRKYTRLHERPRFYENALVLKKAYEFVITKDQIWPPILYMTLSDMLVYLETKGIGSEDIHMNLENVSPKLLHFEELAYITDFDKIVCHDYFKETAKTLDPSKLTERRHSYYNRCWAVDEWIWRVPSLVQNWQLIDIEKDIVNVSRLVAPPLDVIYAQTQDIQMTEAFDNAPEPTTTPEEDASFNLLRNQSVAVNSTVTEMLSQTSILKSSNTNETNCDAADKIATTTGVTVKVTATTTATTAVATETMVTRSIERSSAETPVSATTIILTTASATTETTTTSAKSTSSSLSIISTTNTASTTTADKNRDVIDINPMKNQNSIAQMVTTEKTILPVSPNIFASSGSAASQDLHHSTTQSSASTQPSASTDLSSIGSLNISSAAVTSTQSNEFFVNIPSTQYQIDSLPTDEILCNDPLSEKIIQQQTQKDRLPNRKVHDPNNDKQAEEHRNLLAMMEDEMSELSEISEMLRSDQVKLDTFHDDGDVKFDADQDETNNSPQDNRCPFGNNGSFRNINEIQLETSLLDQNGIVPLHVKREVMERNQRVLRNFQEKSNADFSIIAIDDSEDEAVVSNQSIRSNTGSVHANIKKEPKLLSNLQFTLNDSNDSMEVRSIDLTPEIIIDDNVDEADIKKEPKFLSNLQFTLNDSNDVIEVRRMELAPKIIIEDVDEDAVGVETNETTSNLIDKLMNPILLTSNPGTMLLSRISSSLSSSPRTCAFSEAQRLPSSLEESANMPSVEDVDVNNSNENIDLSPKSAEILEEISIEFLKNLEESKSQSEKNKQNPTKERSNTVQQSKKELVNTGICRCLTETVDLNLEAQQQSKETEIGSSSASGILRAPIRTYSRKKNAPKLDSNNQKIAVESKSKRPTEDKRNNPLVPQRTHDFRSLPVRVIKINVNGVPVTVKSKGTLVDLQNAVRSAAGNSPELCESIPATKSFSASQALATDCTFFENSQLLRELAKVQNNGANENATMESIQLKGTSSINCITSVNSAVTSDSTAVTSATSTGSSTTSASSTIMQQDSNRNRPRSRQISKFENKIH